MRLRAFQRFGFALWLGMLALAACGISQNQLSTNVLVAALSDGHAVGHIMPDGSFMPGTMQGATGGQAAHAHGHTHKGHSDCSMCGAVAAMAALSLATAHAVHAPQIFAAPKDWAIARSVLPAAAPASYSSRAPPISIG